jgi:hypothetical protein
MPGATPVDSSHVEGVTLAPFALDPLSITLAALCMLQLDYGQFDEVYRAVLVMQEISSRVDSRTGGLSRAASRSVAEGAGSFPMSDHSLRLQSITMAAYSLGRTGASGRTLVEKKKIYSNPFSISVCRGLFVAGRYRPGA